MLRGTIPLFGLALALFAMMAVAPSAARADTKVLVIEFTGDARSARGNVGQERLAEIVGEVASAEGYEVVSASAADVLGLVGCGELSDDCLAQAAGLFDVERVLTGEVTAGGEGGASATVELRLMEAGGEVRAQSVTLDGASTAAVEETFRAGAVAIWRDQPLAAEPVPPSPEPLPSPPGADLSASSDGGFEVGKVRAYSWAILVGGVAAAAVGGGFLASAAGKQEQIDAAPTRTVEDLRALVALEDSARSRVRVANALLIGGSVAVVVGAVLAYRQGSRDEDSAASAPSGVTFAPTASASSVGVSLSWSAW